MTRPDEIEHDPHRTLPQAMAEDLSVHLSQDQNLDVDNTGDTQSVFVFAPQGQSVCINMIALARVAIMSYMQHWPGMSQLADPEKARLCHAVNSLADAMRVKLLTKWSDGEPGAFSGWDELTIDDSASRAAEHLNRLLNGDAEQIVDVANFMAFAFHRATSPHHLASDLSDGPVDLVDPNG